LSFLKIRHGIISKGYRCFIRRKTRQQGNA
jgi:hypothetical protein